MATYRQYALRGASCERGHIKRHARFADSCRGHVAKNFRQGAESRDIETADMDAMRETPVDSLHICTLLLILGEAKGTSLWTTQIDLDVLSAKPRITPHTLLYRLLRTKLSNFHLDHAQQCQRRRNRLRMWAGILSRVCRQQRTTGYFYVRCPRALATTCSWRRSQNGTSEGVLKVIFF